MSVAENKLAAAEEEAVYQTRRRAERDGTMQCPNRGCPQRPFIKRQTLGNIVDCPACRAPFCWNCHQPCIDPVTGAYLETPEQHWRLEFRVDAGKECALEGHRSMYLDEQQFFEDAKAGGYAAAYRAARVAQRYISPAMLDLGLQDERQQALARKRRLFDEDIRHSIADHRRHRENTGARVQELMASQRDKTRRAQLRREEAGREYKAATIKRVRVT